MNLSPIGISVARRKIYVLCHAETGLCLPNFRARSLQCFSYSKFCSGFSSVAFLKFMNRKAPQTILTYQNSCLKEAIAKEMPRTKHALCIWLIVTKFRSWFNAVLGECYNEWKAEFYRLYNLETVEDFELGWRDVIHSFGLHTNRHVANLFALANTLGIAILEKSFYFILFFAGMTTTAQSISICLALGSNLFAHKLRTSHID